MQAGEATGAGWVEGGAVCAKGLPDGSGEQQNLDQVEPKGKGVLPPLPHCGGAAAESRMVKRGRGRATAYGHTRWGKGWPIGGGAGGWMANSPFSSILVATEALVGGCFQPSRRLERAGQESSIADPLKIFFFLGGEILLRHRD